MFLFHPERMDFSVSHLLSHRFLRADLFVSMAGLWITKGCLAPFVVAEIQNCSKPAPPTLRKKSCQALECCAKILPFILDLPLFCSANRWQNHSLQFPLPDHVGWSLEHFHTFPSHRTPSQKQGLLSVLLGTGDVGNAFNSGHLRSE